MYVYVYIHIYIYIYTYRTSGRFPMDLGTPRGAAKNLLESDPMKSRLVRYTVHCILYSVTSAT